MSTIGDVFVAINDKTISGSFNESRTRFSYDQVSYKDSRGKIHQWQINVELLEDGVSIPILDRMLMQPVYKFDTPIALPGYTFNPKNELAYKAKIFVISSIVDGKVRDSADDFVIAGKNIGKKNETNMITQAFKDASSKLKTHLKNKDIIGPSMSMSALSDSLAEITSTSAAKKPPMLLTRSNTNKASTWGQDIYDKEGVYFQPKFNGHRCIAYLDQQSGRIVMYSRTMKDYKIPEIADTLQHNCDLFTYSGSPLYLDGELYCHGMTLQDISSLVRNEQDIDKSKLQFHIFDIFVPSMPQLTYNERRELLMKLRPMKNVVVVESVKVASEAAANELMHEYIDRAYEGGVIRRGNGIYEYGYNNKHSTNVLKLKLIIDSEFEIVGYSLCTKGTHAGQIIWILKTEDGNEFKVSMKNITAVQNKKLGEQLANEEVLAKFVGMFVNVEYAELSADGIPLQAKATNIFKHPIADTDDYSRLNEYYLSLIA